MLKSIWKVLCCFRMGSFRHYFKSFWNFWCFSVTFGRSLDSSKSILRGLEILDSSRNDWMLLNCSWIIRKRLDCFDIFWGLLDLFQQHLKAFRLLWKVFDYLKGLLNLFSSLFDVCSSFLMIFMSNRIVYVYSKAWPKIFGNCLFKSNLNKISYNFPRWSQEGFR